MLVRINIKYDNLFNIIVLSLLNLIIVFGMLFCYHIYLTKLFDKILLLLF